MVEDDAGFRETLVLEFSERGYRVAGAASGEELAALKITGFRFALLDLRVGADSGLDLLPRILQNSPACRVVVLTGYGSIATAVEAMKRGAANYLSKPATVEQLERALWVDRLPEADAAPHSLARHEREYIEFVLTQCDGNITKAAGWLGIHRQSLQRKLRKYAPVR